MIDRRHQALKRQAEELEQKAQRFCHLTSPSTVLAQALPPGRAAATASGAHLQHVSALTGHDMLLAAADAAPYAEHLRNHLDQFQPVGPLETALVQSIADHAWRLRRIPELENGIYALGHGQLLAEQAALGNSTASLDTRTFELQTYLRYEKQLRNLQTQETRLRRHREKDMAELRTMQTERRAREEKTREEPEQLSPNLPAAPQTPSPQHVRTASPTVGFVFSNHSEPPSDIVIAERKSAA